MRRMRGRGHSVKLSWVFAAVLMMGSAAPALSDQIVSSQGGSTDASTRGSDQSKGADPAKKSPTPAPTPSPDPTPSPTPSPDPTPSPTPTPSSEPSPSPSETPKPSPDPTPQPSPGLTPTPPSSGQTGVLSPGSTSGSGSDAPLDIGGRESTFVESLRDHPGAGPADEASSFIESVASIIDQLATVDVPAAASERGAVCPGSTCGPTRDVSGSKTLALISLCVILAVAGTFGVRAGRRRSVAAPPRADA
jgi:outer membrane biosynthesis protein TonB